MCHVAAQAAILSLLRGGGFGFGWLDLTGGGAVLIAVIGGPSVQSLGWLYVVPVALSVGLMLAVAACLAKVSLHSQCTAI